MYKQDMSASIHTIVTTTLNRYLSFEHAHVPYRDTLISPTTLKFVGGHYSINTFGSGFKKILNTTISRILPHIWGELVSKKLHHVYYTHFYPKLSYELEKDELEKNRYAFHIFLLELSKKGIAIRTMSPISLLQLTLDIVFNPQLINKDIYNSDKQKQNNHCLKIVLDIESEILNHKHSFYYILYLILRSNWIDSFYMSETFLQGFSDEICDLLDTPSQLISFISTLPHLHVKRFKHFLKTQQTILYECDNSGEVIFDLFFCKTLIQEGHTIYICGKKSPTLNDVTASEIEHIIQHDYFKPLQDALQKTFYIIDSNSHVIGKNVHTLKEPYLDAYQKASLLILKGQANFESMPLLFSYKTPIAYLFGIKSDEIRQSITQTTSLTPNLEMPMLYFN